MAAREKMTCRDLVELVTEYLEGALLPDDVARFEEHLGECEACVDYLGQMRATVASLRRLESSTLPPEARDALLDAFRDWNRGSVK